LRIEKNNESLNDLKKNLSEILAFELNEAKLKSKFGYYFPF